MKDEIPTTQVRTPIIDLPSVQPIALRVLLAIHAAVTFSAGVVLIVAPDLIPKAVGIHIDPSAYLIVYLLAAAELSLATLSWVGRTLTDVKSLRVIILVCLVFHASSGILEIYAFVQGMTAVIWGNIVLRTVFIFLFTYYGLYKLSKNVVES